MTDERLRALRKEMRAHKIDMYIIFLSDDHASEYVGEHFKEPAFLSGFTGSNATLVIRDKEAGLWTDGRYFVQAAGQIKGSGFTLFKMAEEGVPTVEEYVSKHLRRGECLGYDGRHITLKEHRTYAKIVKKNKAKLVISCHPMDAIWKDRPALPAEKLWILEDWYAGVSAAKKIDMVRARMKKNSADAHLLTSLYDIAWLLNLRGNDIVHVPVFMSFVCLTDKKLVLYVQKQALDKEVKKYLKALGVTIKPYENVYKDMAHTKAKKLMLDPTVVNAALVERLPKKVTLIEKRNPTELIKCRKNTTEIENTRLAHIRDGVAVTKFIHYIKTHIGKEPLTEMGAADYIANCRKEQPHYLDDSFETISAYGANAAMMHYTATPEHNAVLEPRGFLLVDSGGHYLEGTTDITRTITLGELTEEERVAYTRVLRSSLRLMAAHFPTGTYCQNLDILARGPMWDEGLDYRCGTGHGVGHILNVHEGPNGFRAKITDAYPLCELKEGMITTDEPGLYEEDKYGIRIENELLCVADKKTPYGTFLQFENLTVAPIDLDAVEVSMLTQYEKDTLNAYHARVYETLRKYLTDEEAAWLKEETRAI